MRENTFRRVRRYDYQKGLTILAFLVLPVVLLITFTYWPALKLFQMSFSKWDGISPDMQFVGIKNYLDVFEDTDVWISVKNNGAYIVAMLVQNVIGLYFAIILSTKMKGKNFFRSILFMPNILNGIAIAFMFNYLYNYTNSPLNAALKWIGMNPVHWLPENYLINFSLAFIGTWMFTGWCMVVYLAGLQSIPKDVYEAASIDGASFHQMIRYMIIPNIITVFELNLFLGINGALQAYFQPFVLTKGGPYGLSDTFVSKSLAIAFEFSNYGKAAAMAVVMLIIVAIVVGLQRLWLSKGERQI
ncbi:sugar ABC transporter permease [Paenibacillus qinlingensis]|uniref:Multiple sugar transport system permease protein n=1 Tax=Paenibacillus qinlingensis TaxID=1837343 RepID=A0ABU1NXL9_9BACL|nr:sugar ABC transporter permease [Paenibacillus qinlingensis]MDR6552252.1 multiple sugar transport system permease protein [Paenibacillus qinlingensis]